jgi:hypothetical protein
VGPSNTPGSARHACSYSCWGLSIAGQSVHFANSLQECSTARERAAVVLPVFGEVQLLLMNMLRSSDCAAWYCVPAVLHHCLQMATPLLVRRLIHPHQPAPPLSSLGLPGITLPPSTPSAKCSFVHTIKTLLYSIKAGTCQQRRERWRAVNKKKMYEVKRRAVWRGPGFD